MQYPFVSDFGPYGVPFLRWLVSDTYTARFSIVTTKDVDGHRELVVEFYSGSRALANVLAARVVDGGDYLEVFELDTIREYLAELDREV